MVGLVLLVGVICGIVGARICGLLHLLQHVLWPTEWGGAVGFAILGGVGIVVALIVKFVGTPGDVELMVDNIHVSGTATGVRMLRSLIPTSLLCIVSGGGMGLEAPLVQTTGTLASWTARRGRSLVARTRAILNHRRDGRRLHRALRRAARLGRLRVGAAPPSRGLQYYEALLPAVLGSLAGYGVYVAATGAGLEPVWHLPSPAAIHGGDLGWAVVAGVGGAVVAVVFTYATTALRWGVAGSHRCSVP